MAASSVEILGWLNEAKRNPDVTHVIIVCDTYDYEDYPVEVTKDQDVRKIYDKYNAKNMQRVMEVYNLSLDIDQQIKEHKAMNF